MFAEFSASDYRVTLDPSRGGSILSFEWRGEPLMRPACGSSIFDVSCFPLVPFSNRIAHGRFDVDGVQILLQPNYPGSKHPHPLHGFGWLASWNVTAIDKSSTTLEHLYNANEWPWPYLARQNIVVDERGLTIALSVQNLGHSAMPAGLGLHPYFPQNEHTRYYGLHSGEWRNDEDCLPLDFDEVQEPRDWWNGASVASRAVDTLYMNRAGALLIEWPDRRLALSISPSEQLLHTVVYVPQDAGYFCAEPVSHTTNAVNSNRVDTGIKWLEKGEWLDASVTFSAEILPQQRL